MQKNSGINLLKKNLKINIMNKLFIICLITIFIFLGCGKKPSDINQQKKDTVTSINNSGETSGKTSAQDSMKYDKKIITKYYNDKECSDTAEACTYFKLSYPVFTTGNANKEINKFLEAYITDSIYVPEGKKSNGSIENLYKSLFKEYETFKKETPDWNLGYALDINADVIFNSSKFLTVSINQYSFFGGAHPNTFSRDFVFDSQTGKVLGLKDLFASGFNSKLNKLIDKKFRETYKLKPNESLNGENGMLFENFINYNDNFSLTKKGISFYYNPYEIAPYAVGPIILEFTYGELKEILKQQLIIDN